MTSIDRPSRIGRPLPAFHCPLDTGLVHPRAKELEALAIDWLDSRGIHTDPVERAWSLATHSADFSCRIVPHGDDTALLLFIEWNYWANAVDDWQDSGRTTSARRPSPTTARGCCGPSRHRGPASCPTGR